VAMIVGAGWGAVNLAADARIPVHCGSAEHCFLVSKRAGLIIWPVVGLVFYVALGGLADSGLAANWVPGVRVVLTPAVLCVLLGFEAGALIIARRTAARSD